MNDERVVLGTALGFKNAADGVFVQGVGREAVDRLGGDGHQLAGGQKRPGFGHAVFAPEEPGIIPGLCRVLIFLHANHLSQDCSAWARSFSAWSAAVSASRSSSRSPFMI